MALVVRIFVILAALAIAIATAGITLAVGVVAPEIFTFDSDPVERAAFFVIAFFATGLAGVFSLVPALALIALAEGFNIRTFLYYMAAGAALGYLAYFGSGFGIRFEETTDIAPVTRPVELIMASGIAGGFIYWLLAGRNAGRWHDIHTT